MANKRPEPVSYQRFQPKSAVADSLLPVDRPALSGDIQRRVAQGWFRIADMGGNIADDAAGYLGAAQGRQDAQAAIFQGQSFGTAAAADNAVADFPGAEDASLAPHRRAILDTIASVESGGRYNVRYTPQGGAEFTDFSRHPNVREPTKDGRTSTAAGRYQFVKKTWDALGGGDFSPQNQDRKAWQLAAQTYFQNTGRLLDRDAQNPENIGGIIGALGGTWEGLKTNRRKAAAVFQSAYARYAAPNSQNPEDDKTAGSTAAARQAKNDAAQDTAAGRLSVAVPGIVPKAQAEQEAGQRPQFKPTGQNTVYGRAYDASGTRTYLQALDTEIKSDIGALAAQTKDDPAAFARGLEQLKKEHYKNHAIPQEIQGDYEAAFARTAQPFMRQAQINAENIALSNNKAEFLNRTNRLQTIKEQRLAALSPENPEAADAVWNAQSAIDEHYDAAVLHGVMKPEEAERAKQDNRRATALEFYAKQAENKTPIEVAAMHSQMRADFAAGKLPNIDAKGWQALELKLKAAESKQAAGTARLNSQYQKQGNDIVSRIEAGFNIPAEDISAFALAQEGAPGNRQIYDETMARAEAAAAVRDLPLPEAFAYVARLKEETGKSPDKTGALKLQYAQQSLEAKRKAVLSDPLSYAENMGIIQPGGSLLDEQTPEAIEQKAALRAQDSLTAAQALGAPPKFLKQGEAAAISAIVKAKPEVGLNLVSALIKGSGSRAGAVLSEFGADAPQITQAGAIMADNGSQEAAMDLMAAYGKSPDGTPYRPLPRENRAEKEASIMGDALALSPQDAARIKQAAGMIAKKRVYDSGADVKDAGNDTLFETALQQAAGQVTTPEGVFGGFIGVKKGWIPGLGGEPVYVDPQIRANLLEDVFGAIKTSDFDNAAIRPVDYKGQPVSSGLFSSYYPIAVPGGYVFANKPAGEIKAGEPAEMIWGTDGKPFVFDPKQYRPALEARVPGAFRN